MLPHWIPPAQYLFLVDRKPWSHVPPQSALSHSRTAVYSCMYVTQQLLKAAGTAQVACAKPRCFLWGIPASGIRPMLVQAC